MRPPTDVLQDVAFEKCAAGVFVFVGGRDQPRQPVRMLAHPAGFAGLERWIAFRRARIVDAVRVEGSRLPFLRCDLVHADGRAELLRQLGERGVAFLQAIVARLLGGALIDANAAAAHFVHHRQQINFEPIGVARTLRDRGSGSRFSNSASVFAASASA